MTETTVDPFASPAEGQEMCIRDRLDSGHGLGIWKLRHAALSIARHEDIAAMVAGLEYGDPALDELLEQACDRSAAMVEARHWGTAVHTFTEAGPDHPRREYVPERMRADVDSYDRALERAGLCLLYTSRCV